MNPNARTTATRPSLQVPVASVMQRAVVCWLASLAPHSCFRFVCRVPGVVPANVESVMKGSTEWQRSIDEKIREKRDREDKLNKDVSRYPSELLLTWSWKHCLVSYRDIHLCLCVLCLRMWGVSFCLFTLLGQWMGLFYKEKHLRRMHTQEEEIIIMKILKKYCVCMWKETPWCPQTERKKHCNNHINKS